MTRLRRCFPAVPASLTALGGDEWDAAMDAWHKAHPGTRMIQG